MDTKKFQKNKENFICQNCGLGNTGDGYTNHCHSCLWSKHVDVNPGDRADACGGMMKPVSLENRGDVFYIQHVCEKCGFNRKNKAQKGDDFNSLINLSRVED